MAVADAPHVERPETVTRPSRILLVGAYERDNLGDLLFLLVTERYLEHAEVVAGAPFARDMRALVGRRVHACGPLLQREAFDAVWTVGGQVGSIDVRRAYRLSAPPDEYRRFSAGARWRRARMLRRAAGGRPPLAPYIPDVSAYPRNAGAVAVLNSAGLSGIRHVEPARRDRLVALLRAQAHLAVRDQGSSRYLDELGIPHRLEPDAVHALGVRFPGLRDPDSDVAVLQISGAILDQLGIPAVAAALGAAPSLRGLRIRLLPAGMATGHDDPRAYEALVAHLRRQAPSVRADVVESRRPLELVAEIRRARVVIGSSLHMRVIAAAYGVPRISLRRPKPTRYARTWDPHMPFDVTLGRLDAAVEAAIDRGRRPEAAAHTDALARRADRHLERLARAVTSSIID